MFDNELRNEKQIFNSLASKVNRLISQYDAELSKLKKRFETINGSAEKEINKELMQLKSDLDRVCNDLQKDIDNALKDKKRSISEQENDALQRISAYRIQCQKEYERQSLSMIIFKGDL